MKAKVIRWGTGLAVLISPAEPATAGLREGDTVDLIVVEEQGATNSEQTPPPSLAELVAQNTPENRHDEISTGTAVGKELIGLSADPSSGSVSV